MFILAEKYLILLRTKDLDFRQLASSRFALAKEIFEQEANKGYIFLLAT
jgi:hypothetical protein